MRGRKPKPTQLKRLEGNPGKRILNSAEPRPPVPDAAPRAPLNLSVDARREWRRISRVLWQIGLYTEIDRTMLEMYCQAYGEWIVARRKINATGGRVLRAPLGGGLYTNPWVHEANGAWERLRKAISEFGMTPSTRSRVRIAASEKEPTLEEQLFAMVGRAKVVGGNGD